MSFWTHLCMGVIATYRAYLAGLEMPEGSRCAGALQEMDGRMYVRWYETARFMEEAREREEEVELRV